MASELISPNEPDTLTSFIAERLVEMYLLEVDEEIALRALHKLDIIITADKLKRPHLTSSFKVKICGY